MRDLFWKCLKIHLRLLAITWFRRKGAQMLLCNISPVHIVQSTMMEID